MRVNVYGEELTERIEIVTKEVDGYIFYGLRFWLKFPNAEWWIHRKVDGEDDDDSSAVTFWSDSKEDLWDAMQVALEKLEEPTLESDGSGSD